MDKLYQELSAKSDNELTFILENSQNYDKQTVDTAAKILQHRSWQTEESPSDENENGDDFSESDINEPNEQNLEESVLTDYSENEKKNFLRNIVNKGNPVTIAIISINILVYLLMVLSGANIFNPDSEIHIKWGANYGLLTLSGEWWRLITSVFLHDGILHLLFNMYALIYIGAFLEPLIGSVRFSASYFLAGLAASLASLWWNSSVVSVGASGAIFGMFGFFLVILLKDKTLLDSDFKKQMLGSMGVFILYNVIYGFQPGIDNAAHIGGLIFGGILGLAFLPGIVKQIPENKVLNQTALITVIAFALLYLFSLTIPKDITRYSYFMDKFSKNEEKAMEIYRDYVYSFDSSKIDYYKEGFKQSNILWMENYDNLKQLKSLPPSYQRRVTLLKDYCSLRMEVFDLLGKSLTDTSSALIAQIFFKNEAITEIIDKLKKMKN